MERRRLGRTGIEVSPLGLGGLFVSSVGGRGRDEARAARFHVASVQFDVEHRDAKPEVLRPVWVWKRKAGTQAKRGKEGKEGKEEGQEEEGAGGVRAFKEGDEIEGVWTKSRGCDALPLLLAAVRHGGDRGRRIPQEAARAATHRPAA